MTPPTIAATDDLHGRALAAFQPGTSAHAIADAILRSEAWQTRGQLALIGKCAGHHVAYVVMRLRSLGIDVQSIRTTTKGEAMYLAGPQLPAAA